MKRREFIRNSTAAGVGLMGISGCASMGSLPSVEERMGAFDVTGYLASMDATMSGISEFQFDPTGPKEYSDELGLAAARSLGISSLFRDLPLEAQLHPDMQARMWNSTEEMDQSVFGNSEQIISSGIASDPKVVEAIKSKTNPGLEFLEQFDRDAAKRGVSRRKRYRLRAIGTDTIDRMRHQPPQAVLEESYAKVKQLQRTAELAGSVEEADRRVTIMRGGTNAYEKRRQEIEEISQYWRRYLISPQESEVAPATPDVPPVETSSDAPTEEPPSETQEEVTCPECPDYSAEIKNAEQTAYALGKRDGLRDGEVKGYKVALAGADRMVKAGGWTLGVCAITVATGVVLAAASPIITAIVSGTIGAILLISGIIVMSVGGGQRRRLLRKATL